MSTRLHVLDRCRRKHPVAEVEDVARPAAGAPQECYAPRARTSRAATTARWVRGCPARRRRRPTARQPASRSTRQSRPISRRRPRHERHSPAVRCRSGSPGVPGVERPDHRRARCAAGRRAIVVGDSAPTHESKSCTTAAPAAICPFRYAAVASRGSSSGGATPRGASRMSRWWRGSRGKAPPSTT